MDGEENLVRDDGSRVQVGDRICCDDYFATVKYIGAVPPQKGLWVGVEWDDPARGKHGGTYKGTEYFKTRQEKAGSFVRAGKVKVGMSFLRGMESRYGLMEDDNAGINTEDMFVLDANRKATKVEVVGAKTVNILQSQFHKLKRVSLIDQLIYGAGEGSASNIRETSPNIEELDLSCCLFPSWTSLAGITSQLPLLEILNVSSNRMRIPEDMNCCQDAFTKVQTLYVYKLNYNWDEILIICRMFPALQELHACYNPIERLSAHTAQLPHLRLLSLECCNISSWDEILKLGNLASLEALLLSENNIESIFFSDTEPGSKTSLFPKLSEICLNANKVKDWVSISELDKLQSLREIRMKENPLFSGATVETVRQLMVARIASLQLFNRSVVTAQERKEAEIDYLKRFGREWIKAGGNADPAKNSPTPAFVQEHPRFQQLMSKWGAPEEAEMEQKSLSMKDTLICVKIQSATPGEYAVVEKKLPPTMTIQKLKGLVRRLYKLTSADLRLSYRSHRMQGSEIEMDNELRFLSFYSVESGDTIRASW